MKCGVCSALYKTKTAGSWRCAGCLESGKLPRGWPKRPLCKCGCKGRVKWVGARKSGHWAKFIRFHHMRLPTANAHRVGSIPHNKGTLVKHRFVCGICGTEFFNRDRRRKYCNAACYQISMTGRLNIRYNADSPTHVVPLHKRRESCAACGEEYTPHAPTQLRCVLCQDNPQRAAPLCECGCRNKTTWQPTVGFSKWVRGHHMRIGEKRASPHNSGIDSRITTECQQCGDFFKTYDTEAKFCGRNCTTLARTKGVRPAGYHVRRNYVYVVGPDGKKVRQHRLVMAEHLGRKLKKTEVVHHKNNDPSSNEPANLHCFHCQRCHAYYHTRLPKLAYRYEAAHNINGKKIKPPKENFDLDD